MTSRSSIARPVLIALLSLSAWGCAAPPPRADRVRFVVRAHPGRVEEDDRVISKAIREAGGKLEHPSTRAYEQGQYDDGPLSDGLLTLVEYQAVVDAPGVADWSKVRVSWTGCPHDTRRACQSASMQPVAGSERRQITIVSSNGGLPPDPPPADPMRAEADREFEQLHVRGCVLRRADRGWTASVPLIELHLENDAPYRGQEVPFTLVEQSLVLAPAPVLVYEVEGMSEAELAACIGRASRGEPPTRVRLVPRETTVWMDRDWSVAPGED